MGKIDSLTKDFMKDKQNFADAYNIGLFHTPLLRPENLQQLNPDLTKLLPEEAERPQKHVERQLDDLMKSAVFMEDRHALYLLLGAQYQDRPHQAMPVRSLFDSALLYDQQVKRLRRENEQRARQDPELRRRLNDSAAFLSGLLPEDRLHPVIILVLYFGGEPWQAPLSLEEMVPPEEREFMRWSCACKINLITPQDVADSREHGKGEFWRLMNAIYKGHTDKSLFQLSKDPQYEEMSNEAIKLLNETLDLKIPLNQKKGGRVNMCKAMQEYWEAVEKLEWMEPELAKKDEQLSQKDEQIAQQKEQLTQMAERIRELEAGKH